MNTKVFANLEFIKARTWVRNKLTHNAAIVGVEKENGTVKQASRILITRRDMSIGLIKEIILAQDPLWSVEKNDIVATNKNTEQTEQILRNIDIKHELEKRSLSDNEILLIDSPNDLETAHKVIKSGKATLTIVRIPLTSPNGGSRGEICVIVCGTNKSSLNLFRYIPSLRSKFMGTKRYILINALPTEVKEEIDKFNLYTKRIL